MTWTTESIPFDFASEFEVLIGGDIRHARRVGEGSNFFAPGTLVFTDCTHPNQNILCTESMVEGWRYPLAPTLRLALDDQPGISENRGRQSL